MVLDRFCPPSRHQCVRVLTLAAAASKGSDSTSSYRRKITETERKRDGSSRSGRSFKAASRSSFAWNREGGGFDGVGDEGSPVDCGWYKVAAALER